MLTSTMTIFENLIANLITKTPDDNSPDPAPETNPPPMPDEIPGDPTDEDGDQETDDRMVPFADMKKLRTENQRRRRAAQEAEAKLQNLMREVAEKERAAELAKMEETDRLKAIAMEAEAKAELLQKRAEKVEKESAVINIASKLGFRTPKDAADLLDLSGMAVDENGSIDMEELAANVTALAEERPYLIMQEREATPKFVGPTNPAPSANYTPMPKLHDKREAEKLRRDLDRQSREGKLLGAQLLQSRFDIMNKFGGKSVQKERDGKA